MKRTILRDFPFLLIRKHESVGVTQKENLVLLSQSVTFHSVENQE